jgi:hypothetical protein
LRVSFRDEIDKLVPQHSLNTSEKKFHAPVN